MKGRRPVHLLIVDDDPADAALLEEYLEEADFATKVDKAKDGVEALEVLRDGLEPDLVVLDLNMPRKGGVETLVDLRRDAALRHLTVIVLTTSGQDEHIMSSFEEQANYFVTKPSLPKDFLALLDLIKGHMEAYVWSRQ